MLPALVKDPNAWLKDVKPFPIRSGTQFRRKGPNARTSTQYAREFNQVKSLGSATSTERTADQTHAARYWAENPPGTWSRVFRKLSAQQALSLVDNARLFAREVTGIEPDRSGKHAMLRAVGVRSTQRLALGDVGGGGVAFTWPAELVEQAKYLYDGVLAPRLLAAAREGAWEVDVRPHLAFWRSSPPERLYMNPDPTMTVEEYVDRWAGADGQKIGGHDPKTIRGNLWPWLLERGYATRSDTELLEPFLDRVAKRKRDVHLRPGLCMMRRWNQGDAAELRSRDHLAHEIRSAVNRLLAAVGDPPLPPRYPKIAS